MNPFAKPILRYFSLWMVVGVVAFYGLVRLAQGDRTLDPTSGGLLIQFVALLPLIWFLLNHLFQKLDIRPFFIVKVKDYHVKELLLIWLLLWIFTFALEGLQILLINWINPQLAPDWIESSIYMNDQNMIVNLVNILLAVVLGPVMEELVFRGLILQRFMMKYTTVKSLFFSSVLFGLLHFESWLSAAIFGLVMGLLFIRTHSLWVPIVLHVANNALVVLVNIWHFRNGQIWTIEEVKSQWVLYAIGLLTLPFLTHLLKKYWPRSVIELPYVSNLRDAS